MINFSYYWNFYIHRKLTRFKILFFWGSFSLVYILIINQFIDLPSDKFTLESFKITVKNNTFDAEKTTCTVRDLKINNQTVGQVCDLPVQVKNNKTFVDILGLNENIFQRQICISTKVILNQKSNITVIPDYTFAIEFEDEKGNSLFDIREFGKPINENHCLVLYPSNSDTINIPIQLDLNSINDSISEVKIVRNLVNKTAVLFILYSVTLIFLVGICKAIRDLLSIFKEFISS